MQNAFEISIIQHCGCSPDEKFLLAVSGGVDSVVMAHLFFCAGYRFDMAHCNFSLRGDESDSDQVFVENMAATMKIRCHVKPFDTAGVALKRGISVQMAARDLRYEWFEELAGNGYDAVAVAHNRNDDVETLLLNLARGCGIRGLTPMRRRQGSIIRPLLFATREEIHRYAMENGLTWREDSSNASDKYLRNRIRHHIIPELTQLNPAFLQHAADMMHRLGQTEKLLDVFLDDVRQKLCTLKAGRLLIDIHKLQEYPSIETLLYELLRDYGCTDLHIGPILESFSSTPGKRFYTRTHCITRDRSHLVVTPIENPTDEELLIGVDTLAVSRPIRLILRQFQADNTFTIPKEPAFATLDADRIDFPLKLRRWKNGDSFHPIGLKGSKKISDFLINSKVPLPDKQHIWVLESADRIIWLVNHRIDDSVKITSQTRRVLQIACLADDNSAENKELQ